MAEYDKSPRGAAKKRAASRQKTARARRRSGSAATLSQLKRLAGIQKARYSKK